LAPEIIVNDERNDVMRNSYKLILVGLLVMPLLAAATVRGADTPPPKLS